MTSDDQLRLELDATSSLAAIGLGTLPAPATERWRRPRRPIARRAERRRPRPRFGDV